jgi:hypothetical protein
MKTNGNSLGENLFGILAFGTVSAIWVLCYQFYNFFRFGQWPSLTIITAFQYFEVKWAFHPEDWIGLYKVLDDFPLSLGLFLGSALPLIVYICASNKISKG